MAKEEVVTYTLPEGRVINCALFEKEVYTNPQGEAGKPSYKIEIAFDPEDDNTLYLETQQGNLYRVDRRSEEALDIQPQPTPGDPPERHVEQVSQQRGGCPTRLTGTPGRLQQ
ncbi:hypothetical protein LCGC14_2834670, partial [marine sediment metagenome]